MPTRVLLALLLAVSAFVALLDPRSASAGIPVCVDQVATITGSGVINGTPGNDVIVGSEGKDTITGNDGDDRVCSLGGDDHDVTADYCSGGSGTDTFDLGPPPAGCETALTIP